MNTIKFQFVEPELSAPDIKLPSPASYVRFPFEVSGPVKSVTLYTTALGVYEPYFNGSRISTQRLLPGFTNYNSRVQYLETDVTASVRPGKNVVAAVIGDGWYRGYLGAFNGKAYYGSKVKFAASVKVITENGELWFYTDKTALATQDGPIRGTDIKTDEIVDITVNLGNWTDVDYDDSCWHSCLPTVYDGAVIPQEGEDILEQERFQANVLHTPNGERILDFGQNMSGHVEFTVTGTAGTTVRLVMGESLDENGNFTLKNLQEGEENEGKSAMLSQITGRLGQTLTYTLKEGTQTYKSLFLNSGFRYARPIDWPEEIKAENFEAIAVYSNYPKTGTFTCSNALINQFVSNVRWSQNSNFVDIPTDCPQRERAGWAGDINVFAETACYLSDTEKFLRKWFNDFVTMQKPNGSLPYIIPKVPMGVLDLSEAGPNPYSSAGWSDALLNVAMVLYRFYGDSSVLSQVYDAAKKFVDFNLKRAKKKHLLHIFKTGSHYKYILDTGYHWGEWLEPGSNMVLDGISAMFFPDPEVATAWLYSSTRQLSEMAGILGIPEDADKYASLADCVRDAYRKEFIKDGKVSSKRQCRYVRPVAMGLVKDEEAEKIVSDLNEMIIRNEYRIGTGFLTTFRVLQTLTDFGYADTAYKMMEQTACPGWLYEVTKGATTTWESWEAVREDNTLDTVSQNHYAPGAACSWLFSHVAGIRPGKPGFGEIEIRPIPGGSLSWVKCSYESRRGQISVDWQRSGDRFTLNICVPESVTTIITMPDGNTETVNGGSHCFSCLLK